MALIVALSLLLPLVLLGGIALSRAPSVGEYLLGFAAMAAGLLFIWLVLPWDVTSHYLRTAIPALAVIGALVGLRRVGTAKKIPPRWQRALGAGSNTVVLLFLGAMCARVLGGYPAPDDVLVMESPLRDGRFVVGQGGGNRFINGHHGVAPQDHALDIVGLNAWGRRADWGAQPDDLEAWAIFGAPVYAPCAGRILLTVDALPDLPVGDRDRRNLAGNHVVIECGDAEVVLAHLRRGSVAVSAGEQVTTDMQIGEVGNSGNTSEPHLHLHVERGGPRGIILDGQAVPMLIDGRYLVRGDVL
jgi:hypothetical protein